MARPFVLTLDELRALPHQEQWQTMVCISNAVGNNYAANALWRGVPVSDLLALSQGGLTTGGSQTFVSGGKETAKGVEIEGDTLVFDRLKLWAAVSLGQATAGDYPVAPTTLPETDAQRRFLEVAAGRLPPLTEHERLWVRWRREIRDRNVRAVKRRRGPDEPSSRSL